MRELYHDKTLPSFVRSNKVDTSSKPKKSAIDISEKENNCNPESIIDSLIRIFDPDYKDEDDVETGENFSILNESDWSEPQEYAKGTKRKRISH